MSEVNPYQSPATPVDQWESHSPLESVFHEAAQALNQTKPWVRFLSVLGFLFFGLMTFGIAFMVLPRGASSLAMLVILPFAVLFYLVPSVLLWRYASRIGDFQAAKNARTLVTAVAAQKSFWQYFGIMAAIVIVFYLGAAILLPIMMLAMGR